MRALEIAKDVLDVAERVDAAGRAVIQLEASGQLPGGSVGQVDPAMILVGCSSRISFSRCEANSCHSNQLNRVIEGEAREV